MYVLVVLLGLLIHAVFGISALVRFFGQLNPLTFYKKIRASIVTAFSTSSSLESRPTACWSGAGWWTKMNTTQIC